MNTKTLIAVTFATLLGSTAASAQEAIPATWANEVSSQTGGGKTRAEVKAEMAVAHAHGDLHRPGDEYGLGDRVPFASQKTRAEVVAELRQARAAGRLDQRGELDGTYDTSAPFASTKSRAEVKAEVLQAQASGQHLSRGDKAGS